MRGRGISLRGQPSVTTSLASETEDAAQPLGSGTSGPSHDGRSAWTSRAMESGPDYCGRKSSAWEVKAAHHPPPFLFYLLGGLSTSEQTGGLPQPSKQGPGGGHSFSGRCWWGFFVWWVFFLCTSPFIFQKNRSHFSNFCLEAYLA